MFVTEGVDRFAHLRLVRSGDFARQIHVTVTPIPGTAEGKLSLTPHVCLLNVLFIQLDQIL